MSTSIHHDFMNRYDCIQLAKLRLSVTEHCKALEIPHCILE